MKIFKLITILIVLYSNLIMAKDFDYKNQPEQFYKDRLSPEVYNICRKQGTERAFSGKYDSFYEKGTYYCACCGGDFPVYSSDAKFNSGTGWPSFWQPYSEQSVEYKADNRLMSYIYGTRTEVVCARCGAHLGHVFDDGPQDKTGKRHCLNSKALYFVPQGQKPTRLYDVE